MLELGSRSELNFEFTVTTSFASLPKVTFPVVSRLLLILTIPLKVEVPAKVEIPVTFKKLLLSK